MKILNKLTITSLKLNKKRTIVTCIGIILSCALICAVAGMVTSFQYSLINDTIKKDGSYHVIFKDVPLEQEKYITSNVNVKESMIMQTLGYAKLEGSQNEYKPYAFIQEMDKESLKNMGITLIEGRLPENSNEIVIPEHINSNGKLNLKVGDTLNLDIGKRMFDGYELNQNNPAYSYSYEEDYDVNNEKIDVKMHKDYKIVGIIERPSFESYDAPGYTVISYLDKSNIQEKQDIAVIYKNVRDTYKVTEDILNKVEDYKVEYNLDLLRYSGVSDNTGVNATLFWLAVIIISIIIVTSVFVIRNSFSISITERFRQYGMLASVGATSKQIKKNVLFEGAILGLISIPIGIICGLLAIYILVNLVNIILGEYLSGFTLYFAISPIIILLTLVLSIVTIFLSCLIPAIRASKISPIDAIRSNNDIKIKGRKLRVPKILKKLFGIEGEIALKNLKRSKKKYRTTILSIFFSIVIFISLSSFIEYAFKLSNTYYEKVDYNILVTDRENETAKETLDYFNKILKLENINRYTIKKELDFYVSEDKYASNDAKELWYNGGNDLEYLPIYVVAIGENAYNDFVNKLGGDIEEYKNGGILINKNVTSRNGKRIEYDVLNCKEGDVLEGYSKYIYNEDGSNSVEEEDKYEIKINKITEECPFGISKQYMTSGIPYIIVSDEFIEKYDYRVYNMYIDSSNPDKLQEEIEKTDINMKNNITNYEEIAKENNALVLVISIFLYGFIAVISLIGITNIFNTITTNMALRSKEFAVLKSIGMTDKEFRKMINFESLFYGLKALIFGIPIGILLSYFIYAAITNMFETVYKLPYMAILISIVFVFLVIWTTMRYSLKKAEKLNIIDTIRNENV